MIKIGENKKYYWLKLKDDFFRGKEIKKLRKIAGGDTYTIIYLKLQLLSLKNEGKLFFDEIEETFYEELALELDEETENVKVTLIYLQKCGLLEEITETEFILPEAIKCIGKETQGAERVRRFRENQKALLGNSDVTKCNTEIEKEIEKEIEIEIEIEKDINTSCQKNKFSDDAIEITLSKRLFDLMLKNNPNAKEPNWQVWAKNIDLAIRVDKRTVEQLETVIDWCQKDGFWSTNILSTSKLRDKFDRLVLEMKKKDKPNTTYQQKPSQRNNFDQRQYDDEYYENFFVNTRKN